MRESSETVFNAVIPMIINFHCIIGSLTSKSTVVFQVNSPGFPAGNLG
jgi:hypothetical protein